MSIKSFVYAPIKQQAGAGCGRDARRFGKEGAVINASIRHFALVLALLLCSLFSANAAHADISEALAEYDRLLQLEQEMKTVETQLTGFVIKDVYCQPPHQPGKAGDQAALQQLIGRSSQLLGQAARARARLDRLVSNNSTARNAIDQKVDGGSSVIIDGSYMTRFYRQNIANKSAFDEKLAALNAAPTKRCGVAPKKRAPIAIIDPLTELKTSIEFDPIEAPAVPEKFCHADEKRELLERLIALREQALANSSEAGALSDSLNARRAQVERDLAATREKAAKAAGANDNFALKAHLAQIEKYESALNTLDEAIRRADAQEAEWLETEASLDGVYKKVRMSPVVDCTKADLTPAAALGHTQFPAVGSFVPDIRPVDIPIIPDKVCTEAEKQEITAKSFTALQNAWRNRDAWNARIDELNEMLKTASGESRGELMKARAEARTESGQWIRISEDARAANDKAMALSVDDCEGLAETGKTHSAFPGVHPSAPEADTLPYDLPSVPEFVCTWEEKQALIERAEAARAAAGHNHRQWSARANALGALLYGESAVKEGRSDLLNAYAEASAQSDYWAAQMLDAAHDAYWDARDLEIRDCDSESAQDKTAMNAPNGAATLADRLQDARGGAPVYDGGEQGAYGFFDRHGRRFPAGHGFDGSEAEDALDRALDDVRREHIHTDDCSHAFALSEDDPQRRSTQQTAAPNQQPLDHHPAIMDALPAPKMETMTHDAAGRPMNSETTHPATSPAAAPVELSPAPPSDSQTSSSEQPRESVVPSMLAPNKRDGVSLSPAARAHNGDRPRPTMNFKLDRAGSAFTPAMAPQTPSVETSARRLTAPPALVPFIEPASNGAYDNDAASSRPAPPSDRQKAGAVESGVAGQ